MWQWIDYVIEVNFANVQEFATTSNSHEQVGSVGLTYVYLTFADGVVDVEESTDLTNIEFAAVRGPLAFSAEYIHAAGNAGGQNVAYRGGYAEVGCFVTPGDRRRFDRAAGTWGRTIPVQNAIFHLGECGLLYICTGAVQLLTRYSYLDLVTGDPVVLRSAGAQPGREHDVTLGVNWTLNPRTSILMNYVYTRINSAAPNVSGDFHGLGMRFHIEF